MSEYFAVIDLIRNFVSQSIAIVIYHMLIINNQ